MRHYKNILLAITAMASMTVIGCKDESMFSDGGDGRLVIKTAINSDVDYVSRSYTEEELGNSCVIYLSSDKGLIRKYKGIDEVPGEIWLASGHYVAEAWAGDSVSASFDSKFFKAYQPFEITSGETTNVNLTCKIANVLAAVKYDDAVDEVLHDYSMTIGHNRGQLVFEGKDNRVGYFMMPSKSNSLSWTLTGTSPDGSAFEKTGTIENVKPATQYTLNVKYSSGSIAEVGGLLIDVEVDESEVVVRQEIQITAAPQIRGYNFDINEPLYCESGKVGRKSVVVSAVGQLTSTIIASDKFTTTGLPTASFNIFDLTETAKSGIEAAGINWKYEYDEEADVSTLKINFEESYLNNLGEGEYNIVFYALDSAEKSKYATLKIVISNASVVANDIERANIWATHTTLVGTRLKTDVTGESFNYRRAGDSEWTSVAATVDGNNMTAQISGLTPGTTYEYVAACDGFTSAVVKTFTTEAVYALPNGGFEQWSTASSGAVIPGAGGTATFWDSGNHGSITLNKNVTVSDSSVKHSGSYSVKLQSQFVGIGIIGKFAAGNIFAGQYGATSGTNATLYFGRTYNSTRPTKLRGWIYYSPGTVDYACDYISKGDTDQGHIYIALSDKGSPWTIDSGSQTFFNKNASDVIAYGEKFYTSTTGSTSNMVSFEIPLDYKALNRIPTHIIIVASASRYGDYFAGSSSSVMNIDDLELVYE